MMLQRCRDLNHTRFKHYGGRAGNPITVCDRWLKFEAFLADVGLRPEGTSIDRIDNDQGYFPGNVRWATTSEQRRNQRSFSPSPETIAKRVASLRAKHLTRIAAGLPGRSPEAIARAKATRAARRAAKLALEAARPPHPSLEARV
jgi:hypothetical protein